jgi:uncharacterized protein (TIGR03437 family)
MKKQLTNLSSILSLGALLIASSNASTQTITTVAGTGATTFAGDGGLAISAAVDHPRGVAVDAAGNIYIADVDNSRVRKVNTSGMISTVAGTGIAGYSGDGIAAIAASLNGPQAVAIDTQGNLIIADTQNRRIRRVDASGNITTIAGTGIEGYSGDGGLATQAMLHQAMDLAVDAGGNIYFADSTGHRVRMIATNGIITTLAGTGTAGFSGDGGAAATAQLNFPVGVAVDANNNVYIADGNNFRIRMVSGGTITTVAGNGSEGFSGDGGAATSATLNYPYGVRVDSAGRIFIADTSNNRVRMISGGTISTVAGTGSDGFSGDGGLAVSAMLNFPWSVALSSSGNLLIGDRVNSRVRMVTFASTGGAPVLSANSMVNGASYATATSANGAVAPGAIVAIFGSNMASAQVSASGLPLPTLLSDASVTMNGMAVPLFYVANGQINAQVPYEIPAGAVSVQLRRGSQVSATQTAQVAATSPGLFTVNANGAGDGAFLHANYQPISGLNPAHAGETILIYCTGLGATSPAVATGTAAPSSPAAMAVLTPTVTVDGQTSVVSFAGLAPSFVGLYQINAQIPVGLSAGSHQVAVQINGVQSNIATVSTQ